MEQRRATLELADRVLAPSSVNIGGHQGTEGGFVRRISLQHALEGRYRQQWPTGVSLQGGIFQHRFSPSPTQVLTADRRPVEIEIVAQKLPRIERERGDEVLPAIAFAGVKGGGEGCDINPTDRARDQSNGVTGHIDKP